MKKIDINELNDKSSIATIYNSKIDEITNKGFNINKCNSDIEMMSFNPETSFLYDFERFINEQLVSYGLDMYLINASNFSNIDASKKKYYKLLELGKINLNQYIDLIFDYVDRLLNKQKVILFNRKRPKDIDETIFEEDMYIVCSEESDNASKVLFDYCKDKDLEKYDLLKIFIEKKKNNELEYSKSLKRK